MENGAFTYNGGRVEPGEQADFRYSISETYLGDSIRVPVSIINGEKSGPTVFLSAAMHGDELNGIEVVRAVANEWDHSNLHGTLVCLPVVNVPAFFAQQRYLPIYDRDLNRSFPGSTDSTSAKRMAHRLFENFFSPCDIGLDFHTSTRGRSNMLHVRADMTDDRANQLARAFGTNVVIDSEGPNGSLRHEATDVGIPTITIEMGEAHRFQRTFIDRALDGVRNVLTEYGNYPASSVTKPEWRTVVTADQKTWLRADDGGLVEMHRERGDLVKEGETICTISDPFGTENVRVLAPFSGVLVGALENPLVYPGNPLCNIVELDEDTQRAYEREQSEVESEEREQSEAEPGHSN